jgi:quinol monooxygenase YgiN
MTFRPDTVADFLAIFEEVKEKIRSVEGCTQMDLYRQIDKPEVLFTISVWTGEQALEAYRQSALFTTTWSRVKPLFAAPAQAWSLQLAQS